MGEILTEDQLEFDFRRAAKSIKFDYPTAHGLTHCMKSVDFIVEESEKLFFIEVKDLDNLVIPERNRADFLDRLKSGELISASLIPKARDSFLYNYLLDLLPAGKPIIYIVLIGCTSLDAAQLDNITISLKGGLPLAGPKARPWRKPYYSACLAMNIEAWNQALPDYPIRRLA